ncbi:MAG: MarR family winged helix-turn-helix transcriptional regulator [Syntrophomonadaceae bacterium]|nr:MarR family winged helix-turn-helix transcriptional regulator [Syntrophomonadaceae bacterium]
MHRLVTGENGTPLIAAFLKAVHAYRKAYCYDEDLLGFTPNEKEILVYLVKRGRSCTAKEIVEFLGISKSMVSHSVEDLITKGYITAGVDERDKRRIILSLSEKGNNASMRFNAVAEDFFVMIYEGISPQDMDTFRKVLAQMTHNIDASIDQIRKSRTGSVC